MAELFCNGGAMRGGNLHHNVSAHTFLGTVRTAPKYRFFSVRDEFPALLLAEAGGASIEGELYDVPIGDIRTDLLPRGDRGTRAHRDRTVRRPFGSGGRSAAGPPREQSRRAHRDHRSRRWRRYRGLPEPDNTTVS